MESKRLPRIVLARVLLRSFALQASWNFERLQNLGVLYALGPALRSMFQGEELAAAYRRHLEYFNTHPFLASPILGAILALEENKKSGEESYLGVQEFKGMVMAPYAAMGDALFWGAVRPLSAGVALFFAARGSLWAPVVFLLLFNLPHFWFRVVGLLRGYFRGLRVVEGIQRHHLPDLAIRLKEATVVLLGGLCAYLVFLCLREEGLSAGWGLAVIPLVVLAGRLARKGVSTLLLVLVTSAILLFFFFSG
jgi:PTS system mannose-specific IID component